MMINLIMKNHIEDNNNYMLKKKTLKKMIITIEIIIIIIIKMIISDIIQINLRLTQDIGKIETLRWKLFMSRRIQFSRLKKQEDIHKIFCLKNLKDLNSYLKDSTSLRLESYMFQNKRFKIIYMLKNHL